MCTVENVFFSVHPWVYISQEAIAGGWNFKDLNEER